jgi:1,4-dihydroxy-2-naphthoate octaprenyltransferase
MVGSTGWAVLGFAFLAPASPAARTVLGGAHGRDLIPVLQGTGVAELLYAVGLFVGLLVGSTS